MPINGINFLSAIRLQLEKYKMKETIFFVMGVGGYTMHIQVLISIFLSQQVY